MSAPPFVAILEGSDSNLPTMQASLEVLTQYGIRHEVKILARDAEVQQEPGLV